MANEVNKTTEVLEFKVEQGDAFSEMERLKKSMIGLKEEQAQLQAAYKKGAITQEEYAKELVRVESLSKKTTATYSDLQKKVTGVQTQTDKLVKSNQALGKTLKDAANDINIAGVGLGTLTSRLSSLINPITASVAIVGALGAAYARSTIGAKDLSFAQAQLASATTIVTNEFARLISSSEDGEGAVTKVFNTILESLGPAGIALANASKGAVLAQEYLEDLAREELTIRGQISERLAENQELMTQISEEQTTAVQKAQNFSTIIGNLRVNQQELVGILEKQRDAAQRRLDSDAENEELQTAVLKLNKDIEKAKADTEKRIQGILRQEDNIADANVKQLRLEREKTSELERQARIATQERFNPGTQLRDLYEFMFNNGPVPETQIQKGLKADQLLIEQTKEINRNAAESMAATADYLADRTEAANKRQEKSNEAVSDSQKGRLQALQLFSSEAGRLFQTIDKENRVLAAAQLATDAALTISGITKISSSLPPKQAAAYKAAAIISAGASIAQAAKLLGSSPPGLGSGTIDGGVVSSDGSRIFSSAVTGATLGASIGSVIPGIGTAIGAAVGGIAGFFGGLFGRKRGFSEGGYTGDGAKYDPRGIVHAGEVVWSQRDVHAVGGPRVANAMRPTYKGYAEGGLVTPSAVGLTADDVIRIFQSMPPPKLVITELDHYQAEYNRKISYSER